jgi:hypothetical protein
VREEIALCANPRLAQLRQQLAAARAEGQDLSEAWAAGRQLVLTGLGRRERHDWGLALGATRGAWQAAYEGQPSSRLDRLVAWLEAWAQDGELPPMAADDQGTAVTMAPPSLAQRQAIAAQAEVAGVRY